MTVKILSGDCRAILPTLPAYMVHFDDGDDWPRIEYGLPEERGWRKLRLAALVWAGVLLVVVAIVSWLK